MLSCVDGWRGSSSKYMQIRLKFFLRQRMFYFLSPCSVNNLTKSQVDVEHIVLAFQSSQCNVTVYVKSLSLQFYPIFLHLDLLLVTPVKWEELAIQAFITELVMALDQKNKEEICLHPTNLTLLIANHPTNATPY